jgi:hypothetical protein
MPRDRFLVFDVAGGIRWAALWWLNKRRQG